jgi:hypothetical protein
MIQKLVDPSQPDYRRPQPRHEGLLASSWAPLALILLVLLDTLSPPGPPLNSAVGGVVYGLKTLMGAAIVTTGLWALVTTRLPALFRVPALLYVMVVLVWFGIWILHTDGHDMVTYLLSPTYSVWSWLMILLVPIVARSNRNGRLTQAIGRIPLTLGMALVLIPAVGMGVLGWNLNASNAAVAMLLILACRARADVLWPIQRLVLALIVSGAMIVSGYRIYVIAALLFALNSIFPRWRWLLVLQLLLLALTPGIYQYVVTNYGSYFIEQNNVNFQDTRSFLFTELIGDLSTTEIWTGRGLSGSYYSPYFRYLAEHRGEMVGANNIMRTTSEVGWLNIVLHLGLIGLILYCIAVIAPAFANVRRLTQSIPIAGLYCFLPAMVLLFAGEMWNAFSASYFSLYFALGAMLTVQPSTSLSPNAASTEAADL